MSKDYVAYMGGQGFVSQARLEQAVREARREALEEAARVAEAPTTRPARSREDIAADIRALMEKE